MARYFSFCSSVLLGIFIWNVVLGMPAPQDTPQDPFPTAVTTSTPTSTATPTSGSTGSTGSSTSNTLTIILVVVLCVIPLGGLLYCCHRRNYRLCGQEEKRQHYNAAYPAQIPGGVYLVPVNQFVPPDSKTGYAVRVDTPMNPTEVITAAPAVLHEVIVPPRTASSEGKASEKSWKWKNFFKN